MENSKLPKNIKIYNTTNEFDQNLPETVRLLTTPDGSKIYVIGTVHFSHKSQEDVSLVIRNTRPDVLVLELCHLRLNILIPDDEERRSKTEIKFSYKDKLDIVRKNGLVSGAFYLSMLRTSESISQQLGESPGGECRRALEEIKEFFPKCKILLGDRPINITVERAVSGLSLKEKMLLISYLLFPQKQSGGGGDDDEKALTQEDMEKFKQQDAETESSALAFPSLYNSFVRERDIFLANSLSFAAKSQQRPINVVGVVGIGHMRGILEQWKHLEPDKLEEFMTVPPKMRFLNKFIIGLGSLTLIGYTTLKILEWQDTKRRVR